MRTKRLFATMSVLTLSVALALGGSTAASAAVEPPPPDSLSENELVELGIKLDEPGVGDEVDRITAEGGEIFAAERVDYLPATSEGEPDAEARAFPSGCGLTVLLYRSGQSVRSSSVTACSTAYTAAQMENELMFWAWAWWNYATSDWTTATAGTSYTLGVTWNCPNTNSTEWRTETYGELWKGGGYYTAAAYDIFDAGAQACGT